MARASPSGDVPGHKPRGKSTDLGLQTSPDSPRQADSFPKQCDFESLSQLESPFGGVRECAERTPCVTVPAGAPAEELWWQSHHQVCCNGPVSLSRAPSSSHGAVCGCGASLQSCLESRAGQPLTWTQGDAHQGTAWHGQPPAHRSHSHKPR